MLVFIDESGDTGLKIGQGSSPYFVVALVIFQNNHDAEQCDLAIAELKQNMGKEDYEFHFRDNSDLVRIKFLETVSQMNFTYLGMIMDKTKLPGIGLNNKNSFYQYACGLVVQNAKPLLSNARIKVDKNGTKVFTSRLSSYLKRMINTEGMDLIKSIKMEQSHTNNLLQLADYVCGILNRKIQGKKNAMMYYQYIKEKEYHLQILPK